MITRLELIFRKTLLSLILALPIFADAANGVIVIGQAIDLSGPNGSIGRDYVAGIKTYFDAINASGGINGKRVNYIARDDQGRSDLSVKATTELIEHDKIEYLFGGFGDDAMQAVLESPGFKRSDMILFAPLAGSAKASDTRVLFWRPGYQQEIQHLFSHFAKLGIKDIGIAYQNSPANQAAYRSLSTEIQNRGLKISGTANIKSDGAAYEMDMEAKRLAVSKPGVVVVVADTIGTALFLKEFRNYAAQTFVAGTSLINLATLRELAGAKAVEWTVFSQVVPNPNSGASMIQSEHLNMMKKYRDEPVSSLTLEGFAVAKALAKAIQQSKNGHFALQELVAQKGEIELGGLSIVSSPNNNHLSNYLDIALFKKGSGLVF
jgi:branched-chain amino acid transport system substrate-binding protein